LLKISTQRTDLNRMPLSTAHLGLLLSGPDSADTRELRSILEAARFAASAENAQPWQFEMIGHDCIRVHVGSRLDEGFDPDGTVTQLAAGGLLQTIRIAASRWGRSTRWTVSSQPVTPAGPFAVDVTLAKDRTVQVDPLFEFIALRSVERSPYEVTPLTASDIRQLTDALAPNLTAHWLTTANERFAVARLNATATRLRLARRDAFDTNQRTLDWENPLSKYGVPVASLGIDPLTRKIFRWSMKSWTRAALLARIPGSSIGVQLQLELLPGLRCSAHFVLSATNNQQSQTDSVSLETTLGHGEAIQRFWLTATQLGLSIQPGYAAIALSSPGSEASVVRERFGHIFGVPRETAVFAGRIGLARPQRGGRSERSRSMRLDVEQLAFTGERNLS
jgi:sulfur-carrier protein adenylyltransferase/sulfurtransferase